MNTKRKYAAIVGILAMIGAALWMRELASWRPVTLGKLSYPIEKLKIARDGRFLLLEDHSGDSVILNLETHSLDSTANSIRNFDKKHDLETFPRVRLDTRFGKPKLVFLPTSHRIVVLEVHQDYALRSLTDTTEYPALHFAWSKSAGEVYCVFGSDFSVWDWKTGRLKKPPQSFDSKDSNLGASSPSVFSPDARWLLVDAGPLERWSVRTGQRKAWVTLVGSDQWLPRYGFSPDSQFVWLVRSDNVRGVIIDFEVVRVSDSKLMWQTPCSGPAKWLTDGRIGIVNESRFDWRDAKGNLLGSLPGPFQKTTLKGPLGHVTDWVLSPDGNWIYSAEQSGIVRRWRAR